MTLLASMAYVKGLLNGLTWPAAMMALSNPPGPLQAYITSPNPNVDAADPNAYIWFQRGLENRDNAKYGAGTVPRAQVPGGPSGTKAVEHSILIYVLWDAQQGDPAFATLFPGMIDVIRGVLRVANDPEPLTDQWTGEQSWLVDVGESIAYDIELIGMEPQRIEKWYCVLTCSVTEVIFA